ncbi:MAG: hypothetical protein J6R45_00295 [Clostridia bacterium]|nr:hypothetical protein [Clostridia bacterium]MBO5785739.1 hypothetical protein [Clostridia bacterium]
MKIHYKKLLALSLVVIMCCVLLCACGISREDAVGTWCGSYVFKGNNFTVAFVLESNGEYSEVIYKNGSFSSAEVGTWEVKGGKVFLYEDGDMMGTRTEYKYKGGALVNNDHYFYKSN